MFLKAKTRSWSGAASLSAPSHHVVYYSLSSPNDKVFHPRIDKNQQSDNNSIKVIELHHYFSFDFIIKEDRRGGWMGKQQREGFTVTLGTDWLTAVELSESRKRESVGCRELRVL